MKQQILIIHGGTTFSSYENYIEYLKAYVLKPEKLKYSLAWKDSLAADLGDDYEVLTPRLPNGTNAQYTEWLIWFEKIIPLLNNNVILIGHSLGGIFLAKYLSENKFPKSIKAVIFVSAPYEELEDEELGSFTLTKSLIGLNNQVKKIILIHSKDDLVVPLEHVYKYNKDLQNSEVVLFDDKGHFKLEHFPELVKIIKTI
jgi:predicted alpha/beta hydrolase family esterase